MEYNGKWNCLGNEVVLKMIKRNLKINKVEQYLNFIKGLKSDFNLRTSGTISSVK